MTRPTNIQSPEIKKKDILILDDPDFNSSNVCIVTGAGSGMGQALAVSASTNGLTVVGLGRSKAAGEKTVRIAESLGGKMSFIPTDLTCDDDIHNAIDRACQLGNIRYLANISGIQHVCPTDEFPIEKYDYMQKLMQRAPFYLSKLTIPMMKQNHDGKGVICNMATIHAHICTVNKSVYSMVKFALRGLTQTIAAEGEGKIRAFTITTPYVKTELTINQMADQARTRGITEKQVVNEVMLGRSRVKELMTPIEAANIMMFGFSRHARFLVGSDLMFDGGMVLTY